MSKGMVYLFIFIGSTIGSYLPVLLFHVSLLSVASIAGGFIGAILGVVVAYKYMQSM